MTKSRARQFSELLSGGAGGGGSIAPALVSDQANTSTGYFDLPAGTTAQRPVSPGKGFVRFNTTKDHIEQYNGTEWVAMVGAPYISGLSVSSVSETAGTQTVIVTGVNLDNAVCTLLDTNGSVVAPTTVVVNSNTQITLTFSGGDTLTDAALEPFSVHVATDGGVYILRDSLTINNTPSWSTLAGSVGTVYEGDPASVALSASDPEGGALTFSITSGALPSGLTLNTSTGAISGTSAVGDSYASNGVTHNFTVSASDGSNTVARAFSILRKWRIGETSGTAIAPSEIANLTTYGVPSSVYYILLPNVGAYPFYIDTVYDGGGWVLALSGDRYVGDGTASPPRDGVAAYGNGDAFFTGTRGSNQNWVFDGHTLNTYHTERLFANFVFSKLRVAGNSFTGVDGSGYDFNGYFDNPAWEAYKYWNVIMNSNASSTFASKITNTTGWSIGARAKQNLVYNQSWSTSYSAGNFKLGWYQTAGPSYGDYNQHWIAGGQAQRQGLSASLFRERYPGMNDFLHDSPTTVAVALGNASHRSGGSYYNNSMWFKV